MRQCSSRILSCFQHRARLHCCLGPPSCYEQPSFNENVSARTTTHGLLLDRRCGLGVCRGDAWAAGGPVEVDGTVCLVRISLMPLMYLISF